MHTEEGRLDEVFRNITQSETKPERFRMSEAVMEQPNGPDGIIRDQQDVAHGVPSHLDDRETRSRSYFASPVAYVFIVIFLLLAGFFTFMVARLF